MATAQSYTPSPSSPVPAFPDGLTFCLLSFEGPDRYAQAGGLGVRITHLAETLARKGFETHLFFVGDPEAPGQEVRAEGLLTWHRWGQWISAHHPGGVYAGEEKKLLDFNDSLPPYVVEHIIRPAIAAGRTPVILAEEWHTAEALIRLHEQLRAAGLEQRCVLMWNANNTMSFHRLDWARLQNAAQITTVSRYMKHLMWGLGVNPLVIPNGIPSALLKPVNPQKVADVRAALHLGAHGILLFKVGRFDPAKRWLMAVEAAALLKAKGHRVAFLISGGIEPHKEEVMQRAHDRGLSIHTAAEEPDSWQALLRQLASAPEVDLYNLQFFLTPGIMRALYAAADAVLANSGHEPFGLVGLEAMAAGGIAFTGATGEEYALGGTAAVMLDTEDPEEITTQVRALNEDPERSAALRSAAREQAARFTWEEVADLLLSKIRFVAQQRGVLTAAGTPVPRVQDVVVYTVVHQPRRLRLPAQSLIDAVDPDALAQALFDEPMNERYFRKVASTCYGPAITHFLQLVQRGLKLAIGFSLSFVEQALRWDPVLLNRFRALVRHENVELVAVDPTHSFVLLWDIEDFQACMQYTADRLEEVFGVRPTVADTTELMMSDTIYHALDQIGFKGAFLDGRSWVMQWREPTHLYHHNGGRMKLLARHYPLSDDVGYRFSDRSWAGWPLMADRYASWVAGAAGEFVVLGWDFETFGEHHAKESGIFDFLSALPAEAEQAGLRFATPTEVIRRYRDTSCDLPLPAFATTWAGSGGLEFFLGNPAQQAVFHLMMQAYQKARLTNDPALVDLARWLAQSDNLHLIQWYGRTGSEAEVSAYFTPHEWWSLGHEGIIWEIQQVYKNFIDALDQHLGSPPHASGDGETLVHRARQPIRARPSTGPQQAPKGGVL